MKNEHSTAIPAEVLSAAQQKINEAIGLLVPYIITLTPEERRDRLKMGDKTLAFCEKALDYALSNPALVPSYLELNEFKTDMTDATGLRTLDMTLQQLESGVSDTVMVSGSEAYSQALIFYNSVKQAAKQNVPGAKVVFEELQKRYPRRPAKKNE